VARISWLSGDPSEPVADGPSDFFPVVLQVFRRLWLRRLHEAERLSEAFMNNLLSWVHPGFSVFAGPPVQPGAPESLESQARYIARPAMAMETPPDPRSGATLLVLDLLSVDSSDRGAYSPRNAHPTLLWRLLQPSQGYRQCRASEF
jgi:hypothetical protein